jgi:HAD superfamily hydrolase (TIGR01509 family)
MKKVSPPEAVIFDLDGLMFDTERLAKTALEEAVSRLGYHLPDSVFFAMVGRTSSDSMQILREAAGPDFPLERARAEFLQFFKEYFKEYGAPAKEGLHELVALLEGRKIKRGVASSSEREWVESCLGGLIGGFAAVVTGEEVRRGKPAPDIFLECARRLGVDPKECLVLEDSEPGARAGLAAGMRVIIVPDLKLPGEDVRRQAELVARSLMEVREYLERSG